MATLETWLEQSTAQDLFEILEKYSLAERQEMLITTRHSVMEVIHLERHLNGNRDVVIDFN